MGIDSDHYPAELGMQYCRDNGVLLPRPMGKPHQMTGDLATVVPYGTKVKILKARRPDVPVSMNAEGVVQTRDLIVCNGGMVNMNGFGSVAVQTLAERLEEAFNGDYEVSAKELAAALNIDSKLITADSLKSIEFIKFKNNKFYLSRPEEDKVGENYNSRMIALYTLYNSKVAELDQRGLTEPEKPSVS